MTCLKEDIKICTYMEYNVGDIVLVFGKYIGEIKETNITMNVPNLIEVDVLGKFQTICTQDQLNHIDLRKLIIE